MKTELERKFPTINWDYTKRFGKTQKEHNKSLSDLIELSINQIQKETGGRISFIKCSAEVYSILESLDNFIIKDGNIVFKDFKVEVKKNDTYKKSELSLIYEIENKLVPIFNIHVSFELNKEKINELNIKEILMDEINKISCKDSGIKSLSKSDLTKKDLLEIINLIKKNDWPYVIKNIHLEQRVIETFLENDLSKHIGLLCKYQELSEELVQNNINYFLDDKNMLTVELFLYNKFSENFITKNIEYIALPIVGITQNLSEEFLEKYCDKIGWNYIAKFQILSEDFIKKHESKMSWIEIMNNKYNSNEFLSDNFDKITKEMRNSLISDESKKIINTRVYNFNLPDDLREYLEDKSNKNKSTISKEIINLILRDREENDAFNIKCKYRITKTVSKVSNISFIPEYSYDNSFWWSCENDGKLSFKTRDEAIDVIKKHYENEVDKKSVEYIDVDDL